MADNAASNSDMQGNVSHSALMSSWDVLSWIAFAEVRPCPDSDDAIDFTFRWGDSLATDTLEALEARANDHPYYIVRHLILDGQPWDGKSYVHRAFSPAAPRLLRSIRAKARKRENRPVSFRELAVMLRAELVAIAKDDARISKARHSILELLRASKLSAWGKRETHSRVPGSQRPGEVTYVQVGGFLSPEQHEKIDAAIFMDDRITITEWGDVGPDPEHFAASYEHHGPRFREVRFRTSEVLAVWSASREVDPTPPTASATSVPLRPSGGRPPKHDWEGFWVEVALYAAANDLHPDHRTELQQHMQTWTAERWSEPADPATIRKRLRRLYEVAGRA